MLTYVGVCGRMRAAGAADRGTRQKRILTYADSRESTAYVWMRF